MMEDSSEQDESLSSFGNNNNNNNSNSNDNELLLFPAITDDAVIISTARSNNATKVMRTQQQSQQQSQKQPQYPSQTTETSRSSTSTSTSTISISNSNSNSNKPIISASTMMDDSSISQMSLFSSKESSSRRRATLVDVRTRTTLRTEQVMSELSCTKLNFSKTPASGTAAAAASSSSASSSSSSHKTMTTTTLYGREDELEILQEAITTWLENNNNNNNNHEAKASSTEAEARNASKKKKNKQKEGEEEEEEEEDQQHQHHQHQQRRKLIWIQGESGSGKTSLAFQAERLVTRLEVVGVGGGGLFVPVKFDLLQTDMPFVGIQDAVEELIGKQIMGLLLLQQDQDQDHREKLFHDIQKAIQDELAKELPFLVGYFPVLQELVKIEVKNDADAHATADAADADAADAADAHADAHADAADADHNNHHHGNSNNGESAKSNDGNASANQLKFCFNRLLAVICSHVPVALLLDDVQWADSGSMDLVQSCMLDTSISNLLILACYRDNYNEMFDDYKDNDEDEKHPIDQVKERLQANQEERGFGMSTIHVKDLSVNSLQEMLLDLLSTEPGVTMKLAQVLHEKTKGNIFYVKQLLLDLQASNLLYFSLGDMKWHWDIAAVVANSSATDNVVDLIYGRIQHSHEAARQVLPIAACIGGTFSFDILQIVMHEFRSSKTSDNGVFYETMMRGINNNDNNNNKNEEEEEPHPNSNNNSTGQESDKDLKTDLDDQLMACVEEGFIIQNEEQGFTFIHDKIQEGSLNLLPGDKLQECRLRIAKILSSKLEGEALEEYIFTIVDLFDRGNWASRPPADMMCDRQQMVNLYRLAGKRAFAISATQSAEKHFIKAIDALPDNCWSDSSFDDTLDLYSDAAEVSYCRGNTENVRKYCNDVISRDGATPIQKMRCYNVLIDCLATIESKPLEAVDLGLEVLSLFKCKFPKGSIGCGISAAIGLTKMKYSKMLKDPGFLASLPRCHDPEIIAIMNTLVKLSNASYYCRTDLTPLFHLRSLELTVKHGITSFSPISLSTIGFILAAFMNDFQAGVKLGHQAIQMIEMVEDRKIIETRTAFVAHAYVFPWSQHLQNSIKPLLEIYKTGMSHGDTLHAMYAACFYIECSFYSGVQLEIMDYNCDVYSRQMRDYSQISTLIPALVNRQAVQNLMGIGAEGNTTTLTGEILDQEEQLGQYPDIFNTCIVQRCRIFLCLYFGEIELGAELALNWGDKVLQTLPGQPITIFVRLSGAVCCYEMARKTKQRKYLKEAKRLSKIIKNWAEKPNNNNPNCYHHDLLLDAEAAAFKGKTPVAYKNYESAILMAGRRGYLSDQALGNELFANYCAEIGDADEAEFRVNEACRLYEEWGAHRKVSLLRQRFQTHYPNIDLAASSRTSLLF